MTHTSKLKNMLSDALDAVLRVSDAARCLPHPIPHWDEIEQLLVDIRSHTDQTLKTLRK